MKKILKWTGTALAIPVALFVLLAVFIYLPFIQNFLVQEATQMASRQLGMKVTIDRVRLAFPLDLTLENFVATQDNDTLLAVGELTVDIEILPLFRSVVNIDGLDLKDTKVNTLGWMDAVTISGSIPHFYFYSHGINLRPETVIVNDAVLEGANLCIVLNDSVPTDTVPGEPVPWQVLLEDARLKNSNLRLLMDSMDIRLGFGDAQVLNTSMNLTDNLYRVAHADLKSSRAEINLAPGEPAPGLDYNHLVLDSLNLIMDSIVNQGSYLKVNILKGEFRERSGLKAASLIGKVLMDSTAIRAQQLNLTTPNSHVLLNADVDWNSLDGQGNGIMDVHLQADIGRQDVLLAAGEERANAFSDIYPDVPLRARVNVDGNMKEIRISDTRIELQDLLSIRLKGSIQHVMSDDTRSGLIDFNAHALNVQPLMHTRELADYRIPPDTRVTGIVRMKGPQYAFDGQALENDGSLSLNARYDTKSDHYEADFQANGINIHDFLPKDSLFLFTGSLKASGTGTNLFSSHAVAHMQAQVNQFQYNNYDINGIELDAQLQQNQFTVHAQGDNQLFRLTAEAAGMLRKDTVGGTVTADLARMNLQHLGVMDQKLDINLHLDATGGYNYGDNISLDAVVNQLFIETEKKRYQAKDLALQAALTADTIYAHATAGDLEAKVQTRGGLTLLREQGMAFWDLLQAQQKEHLLNFPLLQEKLPTARVELKSGRDNPICNFLMIKGLGYKQMNVAVETSTAKGIQADGYVYTFRTDSLQLDTIRFKAFPKDEEVHFNAQIRNNRKNPAFVFNALLSGSLTGDGAKARLQYYDDQNVKGVDMGVRAYLEKEGVRFTFRPDRPLIAYHTFNLTPSDAYIFVRDDMQVSGNMSLLTDEGMGIIFQADPDEGEQQCMNLQLFDINLEEISNVLPYMPRLTGLASGTLHAHQSVGGLMQADGDLHFRNLTYEESAMGDIDLDMAYVPTGEDIHSVSLNMKRNGMLVSQLSGSYVGLTGSLLMDAQLIRFPAEIVNGFIPDHLFGFRGILEGRFKLSGNTDSPIVNGTVKTDSVFVFSDVYNLNLRVKDAEMPIVNSRFAMKDMVLYSEKNDELTTNGYVDFANLQKILINMSMRTRNFQLIDRPRNMVSQLYGKAYMNMNATVNGDLNNLVVRGTLELLGNTDVTYVLKDSPITVEDRLSDLVTFIDFSDSTSVQKQVSRKDLLGMDLVLNLNISEGAHVNCDLSANRESYVELQGGGNLIFKYTPEGEMLLTGRYTINSGEMKYALPVIPLKTFTLKNGSYVHFNGPIMNPQLNITATEQTRASVASDGGSPRNVLFEVGVKITQTLENMGLEFTINALEDMNVQNELASFSKETRGKLAVTMLATGLYMSENSGNVTMSSALNSFLQSEISNIAGNALQTIDLSVGMEDGTAADGSNTTDYSFRFAKRLWGNRVSIIIGGKVSTGSKANASDSFIDDISLEYRLDDSGTRYLRLFHEKNFDSLLDGEITETGGGVVLRKKMTRFGELFIFRSSKKREAMIQEYQRRRERLEDAKKENENQNTK